MILYCFLASGGFAKIANSHFRSDPIMFSGFGGLCNDSCADGLGQEVVDKNRSVDGLAPFGPFGDLSL